MTTLAEQFRQEGIQQGIMEGIQLGRQKIIQAITIKLLRQGQEVAYISQLTDLPIDEVLASKKNLENGISF